MRAGASIILPWVCAGCVATVAAQRQWLPAEEPVASVRRIEVKRRSRGALIGLGIGVPIGIVAGAVGTTKVLNTICESGSCSESHLGPALLGGALGGLLFGLLGAGIGALIGSPANIEFSETSLRESGDSFGATRVGSHPQQGSPWLRQRRVAPW